MGQGTNARLTQGKVNPMSESVRFRYSKARGDYIVGSMCECGHLEREHGSQTLSLPNNRMLRKPHDGNCCRGKCFCKRFTWARFVTLTEMAQMVEQKPRRTPALTWQEGGNI